MYGKADSQKISLEKSDRSIVHIYRDKIEYEKLSEIPG
jgi:hypothetical protein